MNKTKELKLIVIIGIILLGLIVSSCGSPAQTEDAPPPEEVEETEEMQEAEAVDELPVFTLEELSEYDGKEGRPAYVAVDGLVYDFTELERWSGGTHNGFEAGQDLTEALHEVSPHGDSTLDRAPVVGTLEQ